EDYAHAYCRISSHLQTMANRGYNPLIAIQIALAGDATARGGASSYNLFNLSSVEHSKYHSP
ncbi:hypothetical protein, partial [Methylomonas sp. MgM2]